MVAGTDDLRVGVLWRAEWDAVESWASVRKRCRLHGMFSAFEQLGFDAEPVVYSDDVADRVREQLLGLDGVLVWVNPIEHGLDPSQLDPLLREVADAGVWVSAHPDVILRMATKRVLVDTAAMSWSAETHAYYSLEQLRAELPERVQSRGPLVLKQYRGMGGEGIWKVERMASDPASKLVTIQHAKGGTTEIVPMDGFLARCAPYFPDGGLMVEQPFQPRLAEGMIRAYLCHDRIVGFAHQYPRGLLPPEEADRLPTEKMFLPPSAPGFEPLRQKLESDWISELQRLVGVDTTSLLVIWDADFLFGPKTTTAADTYVLCEINASSTFAFPEPAMPTVAEAALDRIAVNRTSRRS
jgi:hypothetical protein